MKLIKSIIITLPNGAALKIQFVLRAIQDLYARPVIKVKVISRALQDNVVYAKIYILYSSRY